MSRICRQIKEKEFNEGLKCIMSWENSKLGFRLYGYLGIIVNCLEMKLEILELYFNKSYLPKYAICLSFMGNH